MTVRKTLYIVRGIPGSGKSTLAKVLAPHAMLNGVAPIAVHNTFTRRWEIEPYQILADEMGYSLFVVRCENDFGSVHSVPPEAMRMMKERMQDW